MPENTRLHQLAVHGQSVWIDFLSRNLLGSGELARVMREVANACDLLRPVWERTAGADGYVSIEVDPHLANDTAATIAQATHFHKTIARPNLLFKIPATDAGVPAIAEMTARGYSINVTLIFSLT